MSMFKGGNLEGWIFKAEFFFPVQRFFEARGGKIGPTRWASLVRPKLGPGWAIKLLARKKPGQIWPSPVWPGPPEFFCFEKTI